MSHASPYPPATPTVSAGTASVIPGGALTLRIEGFCANADVTFTIGSVTVGSVVADGNGAGSLAATAPSSPGVYTITAASTSPCVLSASSSITVVAPIGALPATGSSTSPTLRIGSIVLGLGVALIVVVSVRRRPRFQRTA